MKMRNQLRVLTKRIESLKNKLSSVQAFRKQLKRDFWDEWCDCDEEEFNKRKCAELENCKYLVKSYQDELTAKHRHFRLIKLRYDELIEEKRHLEKRLADGADDSGEKLIKTRLKQIEETFGN